MKNIKLEARTTSQKSTSNSIKPLDIIVVGDIVKDTMILPLSDDQQGLSHGTSNQVSEATSLWLPRQYLRQSAIGGTALLAKTVRAALKPLSDHASCTVHSYTEAELKKGSWLETLLLLKLYPKSAASNRDFVYRIDKVVGSVKDHEPNNVAQEQKAQVDRLIQQLVQRGNLKTHKNIPRLVVINDRDQDFKTLRKTQIEWFAPKNHALTYFIMSAETPWEDIVKSPLWTRLKHHAKHAVIVLRATDLRHAGINIREAASIEQTVQHFISHLENKPLLKKLCLCGYLVIRFDGGDVLFIDNCAKKVTHLSCPFFYTEEESHPPHGFGTVIGYRTIMVSAIVRGVVSALSHNDNFMSGIANGIRLGVLLCKRLYRNGFGGRDFYKDTTTGEANLLAMPLVKLFNDYPNTDKTQRETLVASFDLPPTQKKIKNWTRVNVLRKQRGDDESLDDKLIRVVTEGLDSVVFTPTADNAMAQSNVNQDVWFPSARVLCPYAEFGKIKTVDRQEIDNLTSISAVFRKYVRDRTWKMPLSIATFGPPGSGKSFTVKQILRSIDPTAAASKPLEYNIAQFTSVADLTAAFHQAQDKALSEEVPLIIFDEFDATFEKKAYGWLKYFLAPMQDGKFKGREGTYQVGRAIFVFAGGTAHTFDDFCDIAKKDIDAKGPDFISRLRGFVNIRDINGSKSLVVTFRRAMLLRAVLEDKAKAIIAEGTGRARIHQNIIRAFLNVKEYRHGVRSMEAIIEMAGLEKGRFLIASLPPVDQLKMHVTDDFLDYLED